MRTHKLVILLLVTLCSIVPTRSIWSAEPEPDPYENDSGATLPGDYAKNYMVLKSSLTRDEKIALIYPTREFGTKSKDAKDFLVALNPFQVLATLPTKEPYFDEKSNSSLGAEWSEDGSMGLITLDGKWGPMNVWLVEMSGGKVQRMTDLLAKAREVIQPKFRAVKPKLATYNSNYDFIFLQEEGGACMFDENRQVRVYCRVTNDPKGVSKRPWRMVIDAMWDVGQAKFVSQKLRPATKEDDEG
jgi:hypothetical protein